MLLFDNVYLHSDISDIDVNVEYIKEALIKGEYINIDDNKISYTHNDLNLIISVQKEPYIITIIEYNLK